MRIDFASLERLSYDLKHLIDYKHKHFSFIIKKNKIISIGWNNAYKTHPLSNSRGHTIHSEIDAIRKCYDIDFSKCSIINIRIMRSGKIGMSAPCLTCAPILLSKKFKNIIYTNKYGQYCIYNTSSELSKKIYS